jgi:hypothetical protein
MRRMFKSYFLLSMDLVRGVVKVIEEGMLDSFDDEAEKPVSAAFGAPSTLGVSDPEASHPNNTNAGEASRKRDAQTAEEEEFSPSFSESATRLNMAIPPSNEAASGSSPSSASLPIFLRRQYSYDENSPTSLDLRPSLPFIGDEEHVAIMESISHDAIEEMIDQVFATGNAASKDVLTFDEFRIAVLHDVNVMAWYVYLFNRRIEALGSVF